MLIGIPKESRAGEARVAVAPQTAAAFCALGFEVVVENAAGAGAGFDNAAYIAAGAQVGERAAVWQADVVLKIHAPTMTEAKTKTSAAAASSAAAATAAATEAATAAGKGVTAAAKQAQGKDSAAADEISLLKKGAVLVCFAYPQQNAALMSELAAKEVTLLAMDKVPRISRAQSLDALSAFSNIAGYRAVLEAAAVFGRFFGGQMTAAGNVPPAKVLVIGAGVAGLSAIGAAGNLGAIVRAFDSRPETREQVQSMDAEFLQVNLQTAQETGGAESSDGYAREMSEDFNAAADVLYAAQAREVDIIITTALIPGKPAPLLLTRETVDQMKRGSVVVDLAAANGGNCAYTQADKKIVTRGGVQVIGYTDMAARLPAQASQLYGVTLLNLLKLLCVNKDGALAVNLEDVVLRAMTVLHEGRVLPPPPPVAVSAKPAAGGAAVAAGGAAGAAASAASTAAPKDAPPRKSRVALAAMFAAAGGALFLLVAAHAPPAFVSHFTVFMLACVAGYYVVWNVSHALHTPLMSVTNAISGIIILGALLQAGSANALVSALAFFAALIASINIVGGFAVTKRMLSLFRRREKD